MYRLSIPPLDRYTELMVQVDRLNKVSSVSVRDSDAAKIACVNCDWREEKVVSEVMRNYGVHVK